MYSVHEFFANCMLAFLKSFCGRECREPAER
jgi:hypothetical protein